MKFAGKPTVEIFINSTDILMRTMSRRESKSGNSSKPDITSFHLTRDCEDVYTTTQIMLYLELQAGLPVW